MAFGVYLLVGIPFFSFLEIVCLRISLRLSLSSQPDFFLWRNSLSKPPGRFSSSQTWTSLFPVSELVSWHKLVWFKDKIPKHAFISWLIMRERLTTRDRLLSWGLDVPNQCLLCGNFPESQSHLFFICPFSAEVWTSLHSQVYLSSSMAFEDITLWLRSSSIAGKLKIICRLTFQATMYSLWRERNSRLHSSTSKSSHLLVKDIQQIMRAKLFGMDRKLQSLPFSSPHQTETYLTTWFSLFQQY